MPSACSNRLSAKDRTSPLSSDDHIHATAENSPYSALIRCVGGGRQEGYEAAQQDDEVEEEKRSAEGKMSDGRGDEE
jgi:hypothetical protein